MQGIENRFFLSNTLSYNPKRHSEKFEPLFHESMCALLSFRFFIKGLNNTQVREKLNIDVTYYY